MKVITLTQPWAIFVVMGVKLIETRGWNTEHRGPLLIHAGKDKYLGKGASKISCRELCYKPPFNKYVPGGAAYDQLTFGGIIGEVDINDTMQFGSEKSIQHLQSLDPEQAKEELAFGDYEEGRWGFLLGRPLKFPEPIPCKGALSIWELPHNLEDAVNTQINRAWFEFNKQLNQKA